MSASARLFFRLDACDFYAPKAILVGKRIPLSVDRDIEYPITNCRYMDVQKLPER